MRVYISGPITGYEDTADERFKRARAAVLNAFGIDTEIIDPYRVGLAISAHAKLTDEEWMSISFAEMSLCDAVYFMPGWSESAGCKNEMIEALLKKKDILELEVKGYEL